MIGVTYAYTAVNNNLIGENFEKSLIIDEIRAILFKTLKSKTVQKEDPQKRFMLRVNKNIGKNHLMLSPQQMKTPGTRAAKKGNNSARRRRELPEEFKHARNKSTNFFV